MQWVEHYSFLQQKGTQMLSAECCVQEGEKTKLAIKLEAGKEIWRGKGMKYAF